MSWNGSDRENQVRGQRSEVRQRNDKVRASTSHFNYKALSAGAIIVALGCTALYFVYLRPAPQSNDRTIEQSNNRPLSIPSQHSVLSNFLGKVKVVSGASTDTNALAQAEAEERRKKFGRIVVWKVFEKPIFTNTFENVLSQIVTAQPGERFLEIDLADDLDEKYEAALAHPVEIGEDDDEGVAEMKRIVREATDEVRKAVEKGKKPSEVLLEARDELNKIADFRDEMQEAFDKEALVMTDPKDVLRLAEATNKILQEEYGAIPIDCPLTEEDASEWMLERNEEALHQIDLESKREKEKK